MIIYKKDTKGKLRYLDVTYTDAGMLIQTSGIVGTTSPILAEKFCKPKNIGKSNETSPAEQACYMADSLLAEKLRKGYFLTKEEAENEGGSDFLSPMLAHEYKKHEKDIKFPCYVQPKLDGCRAFSSVERPFVSRTNKDFGTINHITMPDFPGVTFDGELYLHGVGFQENMRRVKKYREGLTEEMSYYVYDIVDEAPFEVRSHNLSLMARNHKSIIVVPSYLVTNMDDVRKYHKMFIADGYEGTMIRWGDSGYEVNKRSKHLLKYKDFLDESYTILDVIPNDANPLHGTVRCCLNDKKWFKLDKDGNAKTISDTEFEGATFDYPPFKTGMKATHEQRELLLENKKDIIGKKAEIRFFEFTESGIPRFPVFYGVRIDK